VSDLLDPKDVERVARAIHQANKGAEYPWFHSRADKCRLSRHLAEAAIRAMQPAPLPVVTPSAGWADGEKFAKE
jgi:hypothetical protein